MKNSTLSASFKKVTIRFLLSCFIVLPGTMLYAQCSNFDAQWPAATQNAAALNTWYNISGCTYAGEWAACNVVAGQTYTWTTCANAAFDTELTIWNTAHTVSYGYNDDDCGLQSTVQWCAEFTGTVHVLISEFACQSNVVCMDLDWIAQCQTFSTAPTSITVSQNPTCAANLIQLTKSGGSLACEAQWEWYTVSCGGTWFDSGINVGVTPSVTTTYYVRAEGACNTTSCASVTVVVDQPSTAPTSIAVSQNPTCSGDVIQLTKQGGTLGGGAQWEWYTVSCGGTWFDSGINVAVAPTVTTTYYVRAEGTCNTTSCASVTVTVNPNVTPGVSVTASLTTICTGTSVSFTASPTNGGPNPGYQWKLNGGNVGPNSPVYNTSTLVDGDQVNCVMTSTASCANPTTATSNVITMIVNQAPTALFTASQTNISVNDCINFLDQSLDNPAAWSWTFTGANPASSSLQTPPPICYPTSGTYQVALTATNSCGQDDEVKIAYIDVTVGIEEVESINNLIVYPNPNNGEFALSMKVTKPMDMMITITNTIGQVIDQEKLTRFSGAFSKVIWLPGASGIYTLSIVSEEGSLKRKVFITQ